MEKNRQSLERITSEQAEKFVKNKEGKFLSFGYDPTYILTYQEETYRKLENGDYVPLR